MVFGMAAASSALDLIRTLTQSSSSKSTGSAQFTAPTQAQVATSGASSGGTNQGNLISPDTMNALFAAQGQAGAAPSTGRADALKSLFNTLDSDGSGGISKSEFETALGAGGTNVANADSVFDKMDTDGDGTISPGEMAAALKPKHRSHGAKEGGGGQDALLQALDGANSTTTTNSDGSTTTSVTYADGSTVTMNQPAASSQGTSATRSYNAIEQMIQRQAAMLTQTAASSLSVSA